MNQKQINQFVQKYLDATSCTIVEKGNAHFVVKLSPEADRALTNRPYYWSFVDRTDAEPETMSFLFVTDSSQYDNEAANERMAPSSINPATDLNTNQETEFAAEAATTDQLNKSDEYIARSLGFIQQPLQSNIRAPRENLYMGSRKLEQIFEAAKAGGSYVCMFEQPARKNSTPFESVPYTAWLGVNIKVEFICDQKREEIFSFGVSLITGHCVENFQERLSACKLSPQLPANVHLARNGISPARALQIIEQTMEKNLKQLDYSWAEQANARLLEELERIDRYYQPMIKHAVNEQKAELEEQYKKRQEEIKWQYEPRVTASAINCGFFHLEGID